MFHVKTKHLWGLWKRMYEAHNWKANVILLFNLLTDSHKPQTALSKEKHYMTFKKLHSLLTDINWHYAWKRKGRYVHSKNISEEKPCYECKQCVEMNNVVFTLFLKILVEKFTALLRTLHMSIDLFHEELLLLPTCKRSDARIWKPAQVPVNNAMGLAFCDPRCLLGAEEMGSGWEKWGEWLFHLLLYSYFESNKINTSLWGQ